jgi:glyoxalase family protein
MTNEIHHITAIASDAQKTYDFYAKVLGLRLVKKTVNQDDVSAYHLFFGDKSGHPGMDLTFFIFNPVTKGKRGNGLVTKISLAVPKNSLDFWVERFKKYKVKHEADLVKKRILFFDKDDQQLELVGLSTEESENDNADVWETSEVKKENAIRHFYSASLTTQHRSLLESVLLQGLGYKFKNSEENKFIYEILGSKRASFLEIIENPSGGFGASGAGVVHHIAFRAKNSKHELEIRDQLIKIGLYPTEVIDRFYFKSVYFRTPAGILFEIATDEPGFTADEKDGELGKHLALPPFLEDKRESIERGLVPIETE